MTALLTDTVESPIGRLVLVFDAGRLCVLDYADNTERMTRLLRQRYHRFRLCEASTPLGVTQQLRAYLGGKLDAIDSIQVDPGGTAFQQKVWEALRTIPPGTTRTYRDVAEQIGRPSAWRAVGRANALNPISIVLPCHRLIGANGALTGYAGGLERKHWLLRHEGI
ncbi:MAG: methylated-DNA--[protein]-cysteine S-methyltransferase [Desulfurellaceae bacterium]|nr:methylated-DNA--[protein]-cysteine S-methyltransferase [Desulfurellaceae bacterium]